MPNLQNIQIHSIQFGDKGIFACASYPDWCYEYAFFVEKDGTVKGRTTSGLWLKLSYEFSNSIQQKIRAAISQKSTTIYS